MAHTHIQYAMIGTMDWVEFTPGFPIQAQKLLRGMIGLGHSIPSNALYQPFLSRIQQLYPDETIYKWNAIPHNILEGPWYDSIGYFCQAIANMTTQGISYSGPNLLAALRSQNGKFSGVSGEWKVVIIFPSSSYHLYCNGSISLPFFSNVILIV
jgi:hypothetical protein